MTTPSSTSVATRYCRKCDYNLTDTTGAVCPECGRAFSPENPKSYRRFPARTWHARWNRWRWVLVPAILLAAFWPKGWVVCEAVWIDPTSSRKVTAQSLLVAHPWWTTGWYGPIGRTLQTGAEPFAPPTGRGLQMNVALWRCDSAALWRSHAVGNGSMGMGIAASAQPPTPEEWTQQVRLYTRAASDVTAAKSAPMGGLSIRARDVINALTPPDHDPPKPAASSTPAQPLR